MASIRTLIFLNLLFSMGFLLHFRPLLTFALNCSDPPILVSLITFFFLLPFNFFVVILLLILHFSIPNSAYTKHLATAARVLTFTTLLFTAVMVSMFVLTADVIPHASKTTFAAAAMMIAYISYVRSSFNLFTHLTPGYVPVCFALCLSMATLYLTEQSPSLVYHGGHTNSLSNILIHLALFGNFILAIVLLVLRATAGPDGLPRAISQCVVESLAKATVAVSFTIIPIAFFMNMMVVVLVDEN